MLVLHEGMSKGLPGIWAKLADHRDPGSLAARLRRRRLRMFLDLIAPLPRPVRVLDVGGTAAFWDTLPDDAARDFDVTILNLTAPEGRAVAGRRVVAGDARAMEIEDGAYDVVFSNSVIEHVGELADQRRAASEIQRVGKRWFVQTPNRRFPIEPHFLMPWFQYWPLELRARLLARTRLGWHTRAPDLETARRVVGEVRLLTSQELGALFPGSEIREERVLGLAKSLIAIGARASG